MAGVRTLRNDFYRACERAGIRGPHCHPHRAHRGRLSEQFDTSLQTAACTRHSLVHMLWLHGNPVAVIAKFLGHRSIATTNQYYLRLSFTEVLSRIRLPWDTTTPGGTETMGAIRMMHA